MLPTGLRFIHFAAAGLLIGALIPVGLLYGMLQVDPRVRFAKVISSDLGLPILAEISRIPSATELKRNKANLAILYSGVMMVLAIYFIVAWIKFIGQV